MERKAPVDEIDGPQRSKSGSDLFLRFVILLSHIPGKAMTEGVVRRHVQFLKDLDANGQLELCGPFSDYDGGMVIIRADSCDAAREIADSDPFVSEGIETYELRTWELSCEENNHMGMG